ncbi:MAG TPA: ATP-binding protein [Gaiellaceae bacterium]|nr:ATP-binding protein [Gaiellaceae bacterium]
MAHNNPFKFGALALDEAFTDREDELAELGAAMRNGQDVLVYAPRRYGKSSLVLAAAQQAVAEGILVGYCDLLRITTKERLAAALAKTIHRDIDSSTGQALERAAALFRNLRIRPTMELDPEDASLSFSFRATRRKGDVDETVEALLELLGRLAEERKRRVVMIFDEFQEIVDIDTHYPNLLRAVFQAQPEVGHVYLGSQRHILDRIFDDENEPFWRSAKTLELGTIAPAKFARFIRERFDETGKGIDDDALSRLLETTGGHPYATQELAYEVWQGLPEGFAAHTVDVEGALEKVLRSEHNHLEGLWEDATGVQRQLLLALASEPTATPYAADYRAAHDLPAASTLQSARVALEREEIIGRSSDGVVSIAEPFFADWISHEQRHPSLSAQLGSEDS